LDSTEYANSRSVLDWINCIPRLTIGVCAWVIAEVCGLVHIVPKAVDVDAGRRVEELEELVVPVFLGIWMEPIWEHSRSWPDGALEEGPIGSLLEDFQFGTVIIAGIVTAPNSGVNHQNVMLLVLVEIVYQLPNKIKWVTLRIQSE
jgi:hypothetical protein